MKNLKSYIFFILATVGTVVARLLQMAFMIDSQTGFVKDDMSTMSTIATTFIVLICVFAAVIQLLTKSDKINYIPKKSGFFAIVNIDLGVAILAEPFFGTVFITNVPKVLCIIRLITLVASGLVYIYFGVSLMLDFTPKYALCVIPVILWVLRLMCTFVSYTVMSNITDNFYDILMLVLTLIFLMYQGKILCSVAAKRRETFMMVTGVTAVIVSCTAILPRFAIGLMGLQVFSHNPVDSYIVEFIMAIYIVSYIITIKKQKS